MVAHYPYSLREEPHHSCDIHDHIPCNGPFNVHYLMLPEGLTEGKGKPLLFREIYTRYPSPARFMIGEYNHQMVVIDIFESTIGPRGFLTPHFVCRHFYSVGHALAALRILYY